MSIEICVFFVDWREKDLEVLLTITKNVRLVFYCGLYLLKQPVCPFVNEVYHVQQKQVSR